MGKTGHHITSLALAAATTTVLWSNAPGVAIPAAAGIVAGASAPDWTEMSWWFFGRRSLLPHRTLTHWPVVWIALALYFAWVGPGIVQSFGFGIVGGSSLHLLMDFGTPMGIPLLQPFGKRYSVRVYGTGSAKEFLVILAWCALCVGFISFWRAI